MRSPSEEIRLRTSVVPTTKILARREWALSLQPLGRNLSRSRRKDLGALRGNLRTRAQCGICSRLPFPVHQPLKSARVYPFLEREDSAAVAAR